MMVFYLVALVNRGAVCVVGVRLKEEGEAREDHGLLDRLGPCRL